MTPSELIAMYYSYMKIGLGSEVLFRSLEERLYLTIDDFNVQLIEKILIISSNREESKKSVFKMVEEYVMKNKDKLDYHVLPSIFFHFSENAMGSHVFFTAVENRLVSMIYLMNSEMLAKCAWGFAIAHTNRGSLFFKKAEEVVDSLDVFVVFI